MRRLISVLFVSLMILPAFSEGKTKTVENNTTGILYLDCRYEKPPSLSGVSIQLIIDQSKNTVETGSECHVSDAHINPARISFKCGEELNMEVDRLSGQFTATVKPEGHAAGDCVKRKAPRF